MDSAWGRFIAQGLNGQAQAVKRRSKPRQHSLAQSVQLDTTRGTFKQYRAQFGLQCLYVRGNGPWCDTQFMRCSGKSAKPGGSFEGPECSQRQIFRTWRCNSHLSLIFSDPNISQN